ncbi:hypothetical protein GCM10010038_26240 [Glutamicibacter protophormiae]|nr:hypothetical protein GCM10010038_26240 [Glutamicibacter protophormiae]
MRFLRGGFQFCIDWSNEPAFGVLGRTACVVSEADDDNAVSAGFRRVSGMEVENDEVRTIAGGGDPGGGARRMQ